MKIEIVSAAQIRLEILKMSFLGQSVHVPSAFSIVELVRTLHSEILNYPNNDPRHPDRDFFVLSKGHGVMALYAIANCRGWITDESLAQYFKDGSLLPGLAETHIPGCEANTGSLGQGFSVAVGISLASKIRGSGQKTFCLVGDGEINEGAFWEAAMFAGHNNLQNLFLMIDQNDFQAMGKTSEVLGIRNLPMALHSFGFEVQEIDGHDEEKMAQVIFTHQKDSRNSPLAVIARTKKGKGVSFMEDRNDWHYTRLNEFDFAKACAEVEAQR